MHQKHPPWMCAALVFLLTFAAQFFSTPTQAIAGENGAQLQAVTIVTSSENAVPDGSGVYAEAAVTGQTRLDAANHSDEAFVPVTRTHQLEVWPSDLVLMDLIKVAGSDLVLQDIFRVTESGQTGIAVLISFGQTDGLTSDDTQKAAAIQPNASRRTADSTTRTDYDDMAMRVIIGTPAPEVAYPVICPIEATVATDLSVMGQRPIETACAQTSIDMMPWFAEVPYIVICPMFEESLMDLGWSRATNSEAQFALGWWKTANEGRPQIASCETTMQADSSG